MKLLLDTHVLLWALAEPERLSDRARSAIEARRNTLYVSAASAWEIEIKRSLGKLEAPEALEDALASLGASELPIRLAHAEALRALPMHHRDPFDRMLVAQARVESLVLISADPLLACYGVTTISA